MNTCLNFIFIFSADWCRCRILWDPLKASEWWPCGNNRSCYGTCTFPPSIGLFSLPWRYVVFSCHFAIHIIYFMILKIYIHSPPPRYLLLVIKSVDWKRKIKTLFGWSIIFLFSLRLFSRGYVNICGRMEECGTLFRVDWWHFQTTATRLRGCHGIAPLCYTSSSSNNNIIIIRRSQLVRSCRVTPT